MAPERPGPEDDSIPVALSANNSLTIPVTLLSLPNNVTLHLQREDSKIQESNGFLPEIKHEILNIFDIKEDCPDEDFSVEGDGASEERSEKSCEDDDLTSLTWLQDKNLLKGINLRTNGAGVQESPTSDYVEDSASEKGSTCSSVNSYSPTPPPHPPATVPVIPAIFRNKHPSHIPYDPQVHTSSKPPFSFSCLIFMAIEDSPVKALRVKEIYAWIIEHFPFYKNAPTGWKNSVRHNLSLNKCFRKVDKAPNLGKGSLWMVDPLYRTNLMQALQKAPFHPCASLDKANKPQVLPPVNETQKPAAVSGVPRVNGGRLPDPELFPYLARRLAAVEGSDPLDDVHAAAAMLQLKHGSGMVMQKDDYQRKFSPQLLQAARGVKRKIRAELEDAMLITSSPSEDHTYSSAEPTPRSEPVSPDEAFAEGSDSDSSWNSPKKMEVNSADIEEQRKIAEGADALLNLAGITTSTNTISTPPPKRQSTLVRQRTLRKTPSVKHRRGDAETTRPKNNWRPGLVTENNNIIEIEKKRDGHQPPAKIRRKPSSSLVKSLGKYKR